MWTRVKAWYQGLANPTRAALATALQTFTALFVPSVFGLLNNVVEWWISFGDSDPVNLPFPDLSVLVGAGVAASGAAVSGLVAYLYRAAQARGMLHGDPPQYDKREANAHG